MKKLIFLLSLSMLVLVMTACAEGDTGNESEGEAEDLEGSTITVAVTEGNIGQFNAWEARSEEFTEETGIEVEFVGIPYDNLLERITTEGISGTPTFDLVTHLDVMGPSIEQFLEPLDDYADEDFFDRFPESIVELSTYGDHVYSLPLRSNAQLLFYRKDVFEDLGISPPTTWEELNEIGNEIVDQTDLSAITPYYQSGNNGQNLYMWTSYLWSNGSDIFDEDMRPKFNDEAGLEATEEYINLLREGLAPDGSVQFGEQDARTHFKQGRSAMWIGWWWVYSDFNASDSDESVQDNVGFVNVPSWEGGDPVSSVSTFPLGMMRDSENKEAAWKFMEWLSEPEREKEIVTDSLNEEVPPEQFSTDIVQLENLRDEELNELGDNLFNIGGDSFENAKTLPTLPIWPQISDIISREISNMSVGDDVEESLNKAADDVEALLESEGYYD
jgi:multiple sugar transport system substrate-binding protein